MNTLYNKSILIGKEPGNGRLMIAMSTPLGMRSTTIGVNGCVPGSVSRCMPGTGVAHCKIEVDNSGNMTAVNMKPQNITFVDGVQIMSKRITLDSTIALGADKYAVTVSSVLEAAKKIVSATTPRSQPTPTQPQTQPKTYSIRHLESVWNHYHDAQLAMQERTKNIGLIRSVAPIFTMGGGAVTAISASMGFGGNVTAFAGTMTAIGLCVTIYGLVKSKNDDSINERDALNDKLMDEYICPNPECHHFLGNQPYNVLRKTKNCPYCRCNFSS